jgi:hypothetical protein
MSRLVAVVLLCGLVVSLAAGCPIAPADDPAFGQPCSGACPTGYFCAATSVCLPGDPPPGATIDAFSVSAAEARPDTELLFTWTTSNAVSCSLALDGEGAIAVPVAGEHARAIEAPGAHEVALTCAGADAASVKSSVDVRVRVVAPSLALTTQADVNASVAVEEVDGDVVISGSVASTSDLGVRIVHGDVRIADLSALGALELTALEAVDGDLVVRANASLQTATLDRLLRVGGDLTVAAQPGLNATGSPPFSAFSAALLEEVGGALALSALEYADANGDGRADDPRNPSDNSLANLASINLPALRLVGASLRVEGALALPRILLPALESVGGAVVLYANPGLTAIDWPVRSIGGGAIFESNAALAAVRFPSLAAMGRTRELIGDAYERVYAALLGCSPDRYRVGDLFFIANDDGGSPCDFADPFDSDVIETLELPALTNVEGRLLIVGTGIARLSLPALESAGGIVIHRNGRLSPVSIPELVTVGTGGLFLDGGDTIGGLGRLTTVEGDLALDAQSLPTFTSLTTVNGTFRLDELGQGDLARLPALARVGSLRLASRAGRVTALTLPSLQSVELLDVTGASLTRLELCGLGAAGTLRLVGTGLTSLDGLAALTEVGTLDIRNHTGLAECLVDDLAARVTPTTSTLTNNTGAAPVPCAVTDAICG